MGPPTAPGSSDNQSGSSVQKRAVSGALAMASPQSSFVKEEPSGHCPNVAVARLHSEDAAGCRCLHPPRNESSGTAQSCLGANTHKQANNGELTRLSAETVLEATTFPAMGLLFRREGILGLMWSLDCTMQQHCKPQLPQHTM